MPNLTSLIRQLEHERVRLSSQLANLNNALVALGVTGSSRRGRLSATARAKIAAAQRARWAKVKASAAKRTQPTLSAAARKRIAVAQRARWAAWRREQKAA